MTDINFISNLFAIAVNVKPKPFIKNGKTRAENLAVVNQGAVELQRMMMSYDCIRAAVMLSKDNKAIAAKAEELMSLEIQRLRKL